MSEWWQVSGTHAHTYTC